MYACATLFDCHNTILRDGTLAIGGNHLAWAVVVVELHAQVDNSNLILDNTVEKRCVLL